MNMNYLGIEVDVRNIAELDPGYIPLEQFNRAFLTGAKKPLDVAVERSNGHVAVWHTRFHGTEEMAPADEYYVERVIKTMLWLYGGFRVYLTDAGLAERMKVLHTAICPAERSTAMSKGSFALVRNASLKRFSGRKPGSSGGMFFTDTSMPR